MRILLIIVAALALLTVGACVRSSLDEPTTTAATTPSTDSAHKPVHEPELGLAMPRWPALDHEPELAVLLVRGRELSFRLLLPCQLPDGTALPAGPVNAGPTGDGIQIAGHRFGPRVTLAPHGDGPSLALGAGRNADRFAGSMVLVRDHGEVLLIEHVGLETWLPGVLSAEMSPQWPVEALAAQAIVARSYAAARWQARKNEDWQLMRGTADIAYDGAVTPSPAMAAAISQTRGLLLVHGGQAILARFHACSGGRTEDSAALWPRATLADGATPLASFMHPVDDPASEAGARGLGWTTTHQHWRVAIPVDDLTRTLRAWADEVPSRPRIGQVKAVRIGETRSASGRVATVMVTHRGAGGERSDEIDAGEFRLAVGANKLRSLWWDRCTMAVGGGGKLVVEGRGFGHGVGLPQVSAWALARDGVSASDIVMRFYAEATLARMWR